MQLLVDASKMKSFSAPESPSTRNKGCRRSIFGDYWGNHAQKQVGPADSPPHSEKEERSESSSSESQSEPSASPSMPKSILRRHHSEALHTTVHDIRSIFFRSRAKSESQVVHFNSRVLVREFMLTQEEEKDGDIWFTAAEIEQFKNEAIIDNIQKTIAAKKRRQKEAPAETKDDQENPARNEEASKAKVSQRKVSQNQLHPSFFFL
uniref:Uncharacterized protein n=2 Tax=Helicotheca tamesis TaxID=374047 RepID=A0A7S2IAW2_9STRA|mmetsp:Transcript_7278/g.9899  ORF Transcript_7278/g.9899 Transcript_7278/m.9899 type:complete len:207 (+) Transcript_7278:261-881(+)|eukprot:CAMPEP_0185729562 /NCGR_PEP_ID=MMETSP1171-20130828/6350_1 /TAXON_ID=374046 /ORGANISM="Helicotheca tamensis, Strain CCMP826" /LENGTH=206 /DNA_ID=CAMNT_0028398433 /DNA_START=228 /DNA_END=848 /DNA_ORIENTATION=-